MKRFNVYSIGWDAGGYGGGLCIVAANDADEARNIAIDNGWKCYDEDAWLLSGVSYEGENPCVLASGNHQE